MNSKQKIVQQQFLNNEKEVLKLLKNTYTQSQKDVEKKIAKLEFDINGLQQEYDWAADEDKAGIQSKIQAKIYQKQYQEALHGQIDTILDNLHTKAYKGVDDYLKHSYEDGFIGTMYDLHGQGIPLIMPIDQQAVTRAVQLDSKISKNLYTKMGENVQDLKKNIAAEVSRGIVNGSSYEEVAQQIKLKMTGTYNTNGGAMARAMTIARTEGHRVQGRAALDALYAAKDMGADVLKQWDSALDNRTRPTHRVVDSEIRELDKPFSNGLQYPGDSSGGAAEVVNCRCALKQRAKWAMDDEELQIQMDRAAFYGLDKTQSFEEFKTKYINAADNETKSENLIKKIAEKYGVIISIKQAGKLVEEAQDQVKELDKLLSEYDSTLIEYQIGKGVVGNTGGGGAYMMNGQTVISVDPQNIRKTKGIKGTMDLGDNNYLASTYHEFAHSLSQSREDMNPDFWKEVKKVRTNYRKELKNIEKMELVDRKISFEEAAEMRNKVFISDYANTDIDEFFAEAFTQAKLSDAPSPFANDVLKITDKYFKRELTKSVNYDNIKSVTIGRSIGASAKNYSVKLPESKQHVKLAENQNIVGKVFAGKGTKTEIRERFRLESEYKIPADKWEKVSGSGYVIVDGKSVKAELHWYEADGEIVEMKVKRFLDEG